MPLVFDRDAEYLAWVTKHPAGFVLNVRAERDDPDYFVLHRASCGTISSSSRDQGAYTERAYKKVCSTDLDELRHWVRVHGRPDGSFSNRCGKCKPK